MTEVELLSDFPIAPDGIKVEVWPRGCVRHVDDDTLAILISEGACAIVDRQAVYTPVKETKAKKPRKGKK